MERSFDVHGLGRGRHDDVGEEPGGVYRTWLQNIVIAGVLAGLAVLGCANYAANAAPFVWSRRVPIAVVVAGCLVARALRRAVIVSPFGLEARCTFISWRVPWSAIESFAVTGTGRAPSSGGLTVVLVDGSTRSAEVGLDRRGELPFADAAHAAQRRPEARSRGYLGTNRPLVLFMLLGIALLVACAVADIGRSEHRYRAGIRSTTAEELRDLQSQIAIGDGFAVALYGIVGVAGVAAVVWSRRSRGVAPIGQWPPRFPDDFPGRPWLPPAAVGARRVASLPAPMAIPPVVVCRDDGVFDVDGTLLASISHRKVASSESSTYWSARGVADFSVLLTRPIASADGGMSIGAWWLIPGWTTPQPLFVDVAQGEADLVLRSSASVECRVIADRQSDQGCSYTVIDEDSRALATIEWSWPGWRCQMSSHVPMTTRRLVCIAALWAERRHKALQAG